jgi:hypothetical protein
MGSLGNNGGGWPPDGGMPDDLPELPAEWEIVVPDDASELAEEAAVVRAELRAGRRDEEDAYPGRNATGGLRAPLLIMAVAVMVTLASLFTAAWPGPPRPPAGSEGTGGPTQARGLPALDLIADTGEVVPLRGQLPAVILLVDGCDCARLVADIAGAVRPEIVVLTVATAVAPSAAIGRPGTPPAAGVATVRQLHDPTGELRKNFDFPPPDGTAAALLVAGSGQIVRTVPRAISVDELRPDLARL